MKMQLPQTVVHMSHIRDCQFIADMASPIGGCAVAVIFVVVVICSVVVVADIIAYLL